jgi:hypothetical protein
MPKPHITRTYAQIHFEDLDPKRFEDLIRELIYDYKDWQNLEATGRSGSDDGFDIRGFEKTTEISVSTDEDGEDVEERKSKEGNPWMIQVKREQDIGPTRIKEILKDVDPKNPPYGYILVASANFSKKSYDIFRAELQAKDVMEFHLWGKPELEDMLHQPKNDRILFTFFGISLTSKRRSRTTEIRAKILAKNKILKLSDAWTSYTEILVRDANDESYPYNEDYPDFKSKPRWQVFRGHTPHVSGIRIEIHRHYAYVDHEKKEYDFAPLLELAYHEDDDDASREERRNDYETRKKVKDFHDHLPKRNQAEYTREGIIFFEDMAVIDDKGDIVHQFPHIFVRYGKYWPFRLLRDLITTVEDDLVVMKDYKRISVFPPTFPDPVIGQLHKDQDLPLGSHFAYRIIHGDSSFDALYDVDGRFKHLKIRDAYSLADPQSQGQKLYIAITRIETAKSKEYLKQHPDKKHRIEEQIGRPLKPADSITLYEFKRAYDFEYERAS